jgi:hypothetical protein
MSKQVERPEQATNALGTVVKVAKMARGLNYPEFEEFQASLQVLGVWWNTDTVPGAPAVKPADNGKQRMEAADPPARGVRQQRRQAKKRGRQAAEPEAAEADSGTKLP